MTRQPLASIRPPRFAAAELDIRLEVAESPGDTSPLLAQWTGRVLVVLDAENAVRLAADATDLADRIDLDLEHGLLGDDREASRWAAQGLWSLASKLRRLAA